MTADISYKRIWSIAYPIILGSVAQNVINVTDTAFLGHVGEVELGASALGGMFYFVLIMLGLGFGTGMQIIMSRRHGEGNAHELGRTFAHGNYFMLPLAVVSFLVMLLFSRPLLSLLIQSDKIYEASVQFVDYRMFGIFFAFGQVMFRAFYVSIASTRVITWSTLVMAVINIILDYGLIFGKLGLPAMGLQGAALASVIAELAAVAYLAADVLLRKYHLKYPLFRLSGFDKLLFRRNLALSAPIMFQNFLSLGVWFAFFLLIEKLGEQALAISNIIRSIYIVYMIPIWGFASAANSMVSYLIGMKHEHLVFLLIRRIILLTLGGVALLILLSLISPSLLIRLYTNDATLISGSLPVLLVIMLGAPFFASGIILFNGVMGTGKTNVSFVIEVITLGLYLVYVFILVSQFNAGVVMVWTSEILYGLILTTLSLGYLKSGQWKRQTN
ncbi:MAG: MATE family efflux transporter [Bacteroidetes bacterium]|nr:MATE family efflux transporter [Bacteroidota bacterium]